MAKKESKPPVKTPVVGDRVRLRGRGATGVLRAVRENNKWSDVEWDINAPGPLIVHLFELEQL
jgi:hypothetical protein